MTCTIRRFMQRLRCQQLYVNYFLGTGTGTVPYFSLPDTVSQSVRNCTPSSTIAS